MKTILLAAAALAFAGAAHANIPMLNATCGDGTEVHADEGGPVYIDGNEAALEKFNDTYYEAKYGPVTVSLSINADGSPDLSYTGQGGANGVSNIAQ